MAKKIDEQENRGTNIAVILPGKELCDPQVEEMKRKIN